jgi:Rad3-related DNA helicase
MLYAAAQNPQAVLNYAYAVRIVQAQGIRGYNYNPFHRELLVCDEADLAEQAIIEAVTIQLSRQTVREFNCPTRQDTTAAMLIAWAVSMMPRIQAWYDVRRTAALCAGHRLTTCKECDHQAGTTAAREYWSATALWRAVQSLCQIGDTADDWIVLHDDRALRIRPIWGWTVARRSLFFAFRRALLMSATLGDPHLLARKLDLPEGQWTYVTMPSYFPAENRPVFYLPVTKVSRNSNPTDYDRLAQAIHHIAEQPGLQDKKGIIHTGSFRVAGELFGRLAATSDRYVAHLVGAGAKPLLNKSRQMKEQIINWLRTDDRPLIALSPSLATGVDIPYEIGFQVIAKVPFGDLGDPVVRARREYMKAGDAFGKSNYDGEAMNTVVQACGRAVRAPDDKGVTFIIDGNFWPLYKRTHTPDHFNVTWTRGGTS